MFISINSNNLRLVERILQPKLIETSVEKLDPREPKLPEIEQLAEFEVKFADCEAF